VVWEVRLIARRQVAEVVVIRDLVEVEPTQQVCPLVIGSDKSDGRGDFIEGLVVWKLLGVELARVVLPQEAKLLDDLCSRFCR